MTPSARIQASIELLDAIFDTPRPADGVVAAFFRSRRYIGSGDRADVSERVYAILRHHARLGWWLERAGLPPVGGRLRVTAWLVLADGMGPKEIGRLFSGDRYAPAPPTEIEQALIRTLKGQQIDHPDMPFAVRAECPGWAAEPLRRAFGDWFDAELEALLSPAPLDIRVNELKSLRNDVQKSLKASGVSAEPTRLSPLGLRVEGRPPLAGHGLFKAGVIEVQDEGSQILALLADARPGMQVVDFCAGAGGKALAMAARMRGKGRIVACDVSEGRLIRAKERVRRAGIDNIEPKTLSSERDKWVKRQKGKFDRVLIDAPCSGTGAWRRNPDARWRDTDLSALTKLQADILESASRLAKPGGRVIYATCSLLPDENEDRIASFLKDHQEFRPLPVPEVWGEAVGGACPGDGPFLRLTPARHRTDGFFVAILERLPAEPAIDKEPRAA
ncbi:MAG TPA: RsmB/NOP family class I SAM-dependent RNA methyltransferase [Alphaproteobacteria bacterium]|nr:RsmB/NOP family class I SAM-dependent RNA methyltransferase [Alphaproteobacteria bacterium]